MTPSVTVVPDGPAVAAAAADRAAQAIAAAVAAAGTAAVSLTGGRSARLLYQLLQDPAAGWRDRIDWGSLQIYWSDERCVPPSHRDSNYLMARQTLLAHVPVPSAAIHRMRGEDRPRDAAAAYGRELRPLDLSLLSLGDDGHIASVFARSEALHATGDVAAVHAVHLGRWRITLTPRPLAAAGTTIVMAVGAAKAGAVAAALAAPDDPAAYPSHVLRAAGARVWWIIDAPAAARWRAGLIA